MLDFLGFLRFCPFSRVLNSCRIATLNLSSELPAKGSVLNIKAYFLGYFLLKYGD